MARITGFKYYWCILLMVGLLIWKGQSQKIRRPRGFMDSDIPDLETMDSTDKFGSLEPSISSEENGMQVKINGNELVDEVIELMRKEIIKMGLNEINPPPTNLDVDKDNKALLYNGSIIGAGNIHRMGDAEVITKPLDTKIRSAFGVLDVLSDYDTDLFRQGIKITEQGHLQYTIDNITVYQVYKLDHLSQTLTLDEYELFVGEIDTRLRGFGEEADEYNEIFNEIVKVSKGPLLKIFNITFKAMVNAILISMQAGAKSG